MEQSGGSIRSTSSEYIIVLSRRILYGVNILRKFKEYYEELLQEGARVKRQRTGGAGFSIRKKSKSKKSNSKKSKSKKSKSKKSKSKKSKSKKSKGKKSKSKKSKSKKDKKKKSKGKKRNINKRNIAGIVQPDVGALYSLKDDINRYLSYMKTNSNRVGKVELDFLIFLNDINYKDFIETYELQHINASHIDTYKLQHINAYINIQILGEIFTYLETSLQKIDKSVRGQPIDLDGGPVLANFIETHAELLKNIEPTVFTFKTPYSDFTDARFFGTRGPTLRHQIENIIKQRTLDCRELTDRERNAIYNSLHSPIALTIDATGKTPACVRHIHVIQKYLKVLEMFR